MPVAVLDHDRPGGTERDHDAVEAVIREPGHRLEPVDGGHVLVGHAQQLGHLMLADQQNVDGLDELVRQLVDERRIVQQYRDSGLMTGLGRGDDRGQRAFQAQTQHLGLGDHILMRLHVAGADLRVRTGRIHDGVSAIGVDRDDGGAAHAFLVQDLGGVDTGLVQFAQQEVRVIVLAHGTQHADLRAEPCGRRSLVGSLAAGQDPQIAAADGLPWCRQMLCRDRVIGVHRADDDNGRLRFLQ